MYKLIITLWSLLCWSTLSFGQTYKIGDIPEELKENANAVYFIDEATYEIINDEKAFYRVHYVVAILNKKAKNLASKTIGYDNDIKVKSFKGLVYDEDGGLIFKSKNSDIYDRSAISGFSIYEDSRLQHLNLEQNEYPYIVEVSYEYEYNMTFSVPSWQVLPKSNTAVVKSSFEVIAPNGLQPNFKVTSSDEGFETQESNGITKSTISFSDIKAIETEPYGPPFSELTPMVWAAPSKFSYEGYKGDFSTWKEIGLWQNKLNAGKNTLDSNTILEIQTLTAGYTTQEDKIRTVYEYVQNKTRYVSIQLGIGGWQPFPATTVDELGYGDCKALSNYTSSLLDAINIESHYTLVYAGKRKMPMDPNFPVRKFNHAILCVPNEQDTVWLECTSQTNPFGYQGSFTGDRDVLIVTPEGGKVVHTTKYEQKDNKQTTIANVKISKDKSTASISIEYTGLQHENGNLNREIDDGDEKLKKWIYNHTDIPEFKVVDFEFELKKDKIPCINQSVNIEIPSIASVNGKRMFLAPNLLNKWQNTPKKVSDRKTDMILSMAYQDSDSITYQIPQNYHIEYLPEEVLIESDFGTYSSSFHFEANQLIYVRKVFRNKGRYPKESYNDFRNFYKAVKKADRTKVVFVDKT